VRILGRILWVLSLVALAAASDRSRAPASRPNVILITLDTTRADRMGFLGEGGSLTPALDSLASQAMVFPHAYAQVPLTTPSHASILTGTYPQFNHVNYMGDVLGKDLPLLPDILRKNRYATAAFVGALVLDPRKLAPGFDRGFDVYNAGFHRRTGGEDRYRSLERRGDEVVGRALAWLTKRRPGPFFLWVHLYDPHDPYDPPEPYKSRFASNHYDGEVAYTDSVVGRLLTALKNQGLFDGSLIAVMADHGEAFGEHGENHHGIFLYDETTHVPLLIKLPRQKKETRIEAKVALIDVAPTILKAVGLPVPAAMQGESLLSLAKSEASSTTDRPVYSESSYGHLSFGWSKLQAWRTGGYLYIEAPERELYDMAVDPGAARNLARQSKAVSDTVATQVADFYRKTKGTPAEKTKMSPEQEESLRALGYLSSNSGNSEAAETASGPDPKARIQVANLLYEALGQMEQEQYQEAVPVLEHVLQQEPNTVSASLQLGRAYVALKEFQKAIAPLSTVVEKKPDDAFVRYELGCALVKSGKWEEAQPQFEAAVSLTGDSAMMHFYLALVYQKLSRDSDAEKEFQNAVRLEPDNFPANLLLGRLYVMQQKPSAALPLLRKATKLRPDSIDAHLFLGQVFTQLGQSASAGREAAEAERLRSQGASRLGTPREKSGNSSTRN
jgi:arylsulfatase A-like enzyme/Tfp pilus assembly protein PilF